MAIKCGFFNSVEKDRLYTAEEMSRPYELLISNGVFATPQGTPSDYLQIFANTGFTVTVKSGRGIFFNKWFILTEDMTLTIPIPHLTLNRIDSIVVQIDCTESVRAGTIIIKNGTPNNVPVPPTLIRSDKIMEYRLANIAVSAGSSLITQSNITDTRGSSECGFITSLIQQVDTSTLLAQFHDAFYTWFEEAQQSILTKTNFKEFHSKYTATSTVSTIPIQITGFNRIVDSLQVHINGLYVDPTEYTIPNNNNIVLSSPIISGSIVSFTVYKPIDPVLAITTVPTNAPYSPPGVRAYYQIMLSTVKSESGVDNVNVGDVLCCFTNDYLYPVVYVDENNNEVYTGDRYQN